MKEKKVYPAWIAVVLFLSLVSCAKPTTLSKIKNSGELVIGSDLTYPPFEYIDKGTKEIVGFDIDVIKEIAQELKVKVRIVNIPFEGIIPALQEKKFDVIISALPITEERTKQVAFSDPYYDAGQIIVVHRENTTIKGLTNLKGRKVGVQLGTAGEMEARKIEGAQVKDYDIIDLAFPDLITKKIDAVITDAPTAYDFVNKQREIKLVGKPFTQEQFAIAVRREDKDLLLEINKALKKIRESGRLAEIEKKWIAKR